jgi:cytochrome P450
MTIRVGKENINSQSRSVCPFTMYSNILDTLRREYWLYYFLIPGPILFILFSLWKYIYAPYASPLACIRGPKNKHWFYGFLSPSEARGFQMSPKLLEHCSEYDGVWYATFTNRKPTLVLGDQEAINYVLNNAQTYVRAEAQMRVTRLLFGEGLVGVDGAQHRRQRKVVGPAFSSAAVDGMAPVFYQMAEKLANNWESELIKARKFETNAYRDFEALSIDIIGLAGFKYDFKSLQGERSDLEAAFVNVTKSAATGSVYASLRAQFPFVGTLGHFLSREQMQLDRHKRDIEKISERLVQGAKDAMKQSGSTGLVEKGDQQSHQIKDILTLLVRSNISSDVKDRLPEKEIVSLIPTFLSGGYDNNASAMSYAIYGLSQFPETQSRLRNELLHPPRECSTWRENLRALDSLPYLDAVTREVLRLYSPAHSIPRTCAASKEDVIPLGKPILLRDGTWTEHIRIGAGDDVVIPQKWMNVDQSTWGPDANEFKPERWIEDTEHPYYAGGLPARVKNCKSSGWSHLMTFSIGPRNCIGYRMAVAEFKVGLAVLVSKFEFLKHDEMRQVYGEVQIVDRPRVHGRDGYCMPAWVKAAE